MFPSLKNLKNPFGNEKPVVVKKPMSSFSKFMIFMVIFISLIGSLFAAYTLNNPDVMNYISNINPSTVLYVIFMGFIALCILAIVFRIFYYFLFDINGSSMFWLVVHLLLLAICSPYFLIVLIWGTYIFLTTKPSPSGRAERKASENAEKKKMEAIEKKNLAIKEAARKMKEKEVEAKRLAEKGKSSWNPFGKESTKESTKEETTTKEKSSWNPFGKKSTKEETATKENSSWNPFGKKSTKETTKESTEENKVPPLRRVPSAILLGGGGEEESDSMERFGNILIEVDTKMIDLWHILLYIYTIQEKILDSSISVYLHKILGE